VNLLFVQATHNLVVFCTTNVRKFTYLSLLDNLEPRKVKDDKQDSK